MRILKLCLIIVLKLISALNINLAEDEYLSPSIQLFLFIHPYNKLSILPFSLSSIEEQFYPKDRIRIFIQTELFKNNDKNNPEFQDYIKMNTLTIDLVKKWIQHNKHQYKDIEFFLSDHSVDDNYEKDMTYLTRNRFEYIIKLKTDGLRHSRRNGAHFALFMDSDVVLTNHFVFDSMTKNNDFIAMSPMLNSLGTYSNFWAGITAEGYYKRSDDYLPILKRQEIGEFVVPMINSCIFINLRRKSSLNLTFDPTMISEDLPFDDAIAFAKSAQKNNVDLYINNRRVWGYIPPYMEDTIDMNTVDEDVIELQLKAVNDGHDLPIAPSVISHVNRPKSDKLNADNVYVINLLRRPERLEKMVKSFEILGIEAEVFTAMDGKQLNTSYIKSMGIKVIDGYIDPVTKRPMTFGEIGCFLSHYLIWHDMIRRGFSQVIVLEDDLRFVRDFKENWFEAYSLLNTDEYDFVYLGRKVQDLSKSEHFINEWYCIPNYSYWTIGYFITRRGAEKLINANPLSKLIPVDEFLPIMYDKHNNPDLKAHYPIRNLNALSLTKYLIFPTHFRFDPQYISDTEHSTKLTEDVEQESLTLHNEL